MFRTLLPKIPPILVLLLLAVPVCSQKVETHYDQKTDFSTYKRYAWGKNYLITRQLPQDQARMDKAIVDAINRQLQAKGFVRDEEHPDFVVMYEGGGLSHIQTGAHMDYTSPRGPAWTYSSDSLGNSSLDVWASIMAHLQVIIVDARSSSVAWQTHVSKKVREPKKAFAPMLSKETGWVRTLGC